MEGRTPKVTRSARESNCFPNSDCAFNILAKNPSKKSEIAAIQIRYAVSVILPSKTKMIPKIPQHRLVSVNKFGMLFLIAFIKSINIWRKMDCDVFPDQAL